MKLQDITVRGLRGITQLELPFGTGINVIAGINGAGKSSLLYAVEIALSWLKARLRSKSSNGIYPGSNDINTVLNRLYIRMEAIDNGQSFSWVINRYSPSYRKARVKSDFTQLTSFADSLMERFFNSDGKMNMPMFVKYSVNRSLIDVPVKVHKKHRLDIMDLYDEPLDAGVNLRSFYEWFREREDIENEKKVEARDFSLQDPQLRAVRQALSRVLPEYSNLRTRRSKPAGFVLTKGDHELRVDQLSDGEKCYLTLIGDIARRLAIFNPVGDPLMGEGIILIDELELHLHPKWQVEAVEKLREVFPNCQFFITTHSPHIVQNLHIYPGEKDSLLVLKDGEAYPVSAAYGLPVDSVLLKIFDLDSLRPPLVNMKEQELWKLLADGKEDSEEYIRKERELKDLLPQGDLLFVRLNAQKLLNKKTRK